MAKVTLWLTALLWRQFRMACLERNTSASKEVARLMQQQLAQWAQGKEEARHG